ncbi:hypothetical protein [Shouchella clausii]|uniref:hypothetical protein n=1 Tax=Shouchella clausii TaxID=79880 RepID=UPI001C7362DC|nr:hypothetical protein [Shouchella clausii]MBX0320147.1 hypothetical protein [Shouchella clausii]MEB5480839.1 hypothetical protein [Shouchella clausii]
MLSKQLETAIEKAKIFKVYDKGRYTIYFEEWHDVTELHIKQSGQLLIKIIKNNVTGIKTVAYEKEEGSKAEKRQIKEIKDYFNL